MRHRLAISLLTLVVMACSRQPSALTQSEAAVRSDVGEAAKTNVGFMHDSTHLLVQLQGAEMASVSDSAFPTRAQHIAQIALRSYPGSAHVDSVTVSVGEVLAPNMAFRVLRSRTFSSRELQ